MSDDPVISFSWHFTVERPPVEVRPRTRRGYCRLCGNTRWHWKGCDGEQEK